MRCGYAVPLYLLALQSHTRCAAQVCLNDFCDNPCNGTETECHGLTVGNTLLAAKMYTKKKTMVGQERPGFKTKVGKSKGPAGHGSRHDANDNDGLPWAGNLNSSNLSCGVSTFAPGLFRCPTKCPLLAEDVKVGCHWQCISQARCDKVMDEDWGLCRDCEVSACKKCAAGKDFCSECVSGFDLVRGQCLSALRHFWHGFLIFLMALTLVFLTWYLNLLSQPTLRPEVLEKALFHRWSTCLRNWDGDHDFYPLMSDLRAVPHDAEPPIGGPGLMLMFNFQYYVLVWASVALIGWLALGAVFGTELWVLGTIYVEDPQDMCQAVHWGRAQRDRLRLAKLGFTFAFYVFSSVGIIWAAVQQLHRFNAADDKAATMMDYVAEVTGFPQQSGPNVEADIENFLHAAIGCRPVGVSVWWDFRNDHAQVLKLLHFLTRKREHEMDTKALLPQRSRSLTAGTLDRLWFEAGEQRESVSARLAVFRWLCCACNPLFQWLDRLGLGLLKIEEDDSGEMSTHRSSELNTDQQVEEMLGRIHSVGTVFAVFPTEHDRDRALEVFKGPEAMKYDGTYTIYARKRYQEPENVMWENLPIKDLQRARNTMFGVLFTVGAVVVWGVFFWAPYARYSAAISGNVPPTFLNGLSLSMLVVLGNQLMYLLCGTVAERVGYQSKDGTQCAYVVLYTFAIIINAAFDISIVVYTSYLRMTATGVRTDEGVLLTDLPDSAAILESYPMMKVFGFTLFQYNFPSCFLIPFMAEGIFTIVLPYHIGCQIVRTRHVTHDNAEGCLSPIPMDLSRYGDILVNIILTTVSFFTASGWVLYTLLGLMIGHAYVYAFDQYRVLRHVEGFYFASRNIESVVEQMAVIPCGVLAASVAFQLHGLGIGGNVWFFMASAFIVHVVVHWLALTHIVDNANKSEKHEQTATPYDEVAKHFPQNWFTDNPIHCLRSKYIHGHDPPCTFYTKGKDYIIQPNPSIGQHYDGLKAWTPKGDHAPSNQLFRRS